MAVQSYRIHSFKTMNLMIYYFLASVLLFAFQPDAFAQKNTDSWAVLNKAHSSGKINDTAYFNAIDTLVAQFYNLPSLKEKLKKYEQLAWSKSAYHKYRTYYYTYLANNASATYRTGASMFYLEQREEEIKKKKPYVNSLAVERTKLFTYGRNKSGFKRCREVFTSVSSFLDSLPHRILMDSIPNVTCQNAMCILNAQALICGTENDTAGFYYVKHLSDEIFKSIKAKEPVYAPLDIFEFYNAYADIQLQIFLDNPENRRKALDKAYNIVSHSQSLDILFKKSAEVDLIMELINFYIDLKQNDSAAYYLDILEKRLPDGMAELSDGSYYFHIQSKLLFNKGLYKEAYTQLEKVLAIRDSVTAIKMADIDNNLHAEATAYHKEATIRKLEEQKKKRNMLASGISVMTISIFIGLIFLMKRKNEKKIKEKIEELNMLTQIEIAELEIKANSIQRKMGMELHDDVAGRLVNACNFIEKQMLDENNQQNKERLRAIADIVRDAYKIIRYKSHEWYSEGLKEEHASFSESVQKLIEQALPDDEYKKEIEIDNESINKASITIRIQLLRIIQEAVTNVLKHAQANEVKLFIYEDEDKIMMQFNDNGKGFHLHPLSKHKGMGLESIRSRVTEANGLLGIASSANGTELAIEIPL